MSNISKLKNKFSSLDSILQQTQSLNSPDYTKDQELYWKPTPDKAGNAMAIIRFLPAPEVDGDDGAPFVRKFSHGFQSETGMWLIEDCPTSIGEQCPVCDHNKQLWATGIEANKKLVSDQKRKLSYYANIYVVSDPANPDNNGKVKLFKFGQKIYDKIEDALKPKFQDEKPINPFDPWGGANFKLKVTGKGRDTNYDNSVFESPSALFEGDEDKIERVWKESHSLAKIVSKDNFKEYDALKQRLDKVFAGTSQGNKPSARMSKVHDDVDSDDPPFSTSDSAADDDLAFFKSLAKDD